MNHAEVLANTSLFENAPADVLATLASKARERKMVRGDKLFGEGDAPDALYVVLSGRIAIAVDNRPYDNRESVMALMVEGDLFGEIAMLDDGPRSAAARALEPTTVLELRYDDVLPLIRGNNDLMWNVVRLLAGRLRQVDEALADSVFLDVTGRTAKRLLELSEGKNDFMLPVTQEELAGMVGASRERVNKAIASFIRLKWLEQSDRHYKILHREQLEQRAR